MVLADFPLDDVQLNNNQSNSPGGRNIFAPHTRPSPLAENEVATAAHPTGTSSDSENEKTP